MDVESLLRWLRHWPPVGEDSRHLNPGEPRMVNFSKNSLEIQPIV